jgi:hypothetical protein
VEAAYDLIFANQLRARLTGDLPVSSNVRFADVRRRAAPPAPAGAAQKAQQLLQSLPGGGVALARPPPRAAATAAAVYGGLAAWTLAQGLLEPSPEAAAADVPGVQLALATAACVYLLRDQKRVGLGKAAALALAGLVAGTFLGAAVQSWLRVDIIPLGVRYTQRRRRCLLATGKPITPLAAKAPAGADRAAPSCVVPSTASGGRCLLTHQPSRPVTLGNSSSPPRLLSSPRRASPPPASWLASSPSSPWPPSASSSRDARGGGVAVPRAALGVPAPIQGQPPLSAPPWPCTLIFPLPCSFRFDLMSLFPLAPLPSRRAPGERARHAPPAPPTCPTTRACGVSTHRPSGPNAGASPARHSAIHFTPAWPAHACTACGVEGPDFIAALLP